MIRFVTGIPPLARQIRSLAGKFQPDLVYINGPRLLPAAAWARVRKPVLFHAHIEVTQTLARRVAGFALARLNAHVVSVCHAVAEAWRPFVGPERVSVIYNGVAGPASHTTRPAGGVRIGCIGRIAPEKGQREFLRAAARIHSALPESRFVICGAALFSDGAALSYERQIRDDAAGLPVEFPGWAADVYAVMANLDLLLVPSVWPEPNPRVVLEAFAAGLPVVAFRAGGLPEIIEDGRTGFLCDDVEQMARLAVTLLQGDRALLRQVSEAARESWRRNFTVERWQQQILGAMERVAGG
jgi:glycosyltransferase involved in cell wall biosynthesis